MSTKLKCHKYINICHIQVKFKHSKSLLYFVRYTYCIILGFIFLTGILPWKKVSSCQHAIYTRIDDVNTVLSANNATDKNDAMKQ